MLRLPHVRFPNLKSELCLHDSEKGDGAKTLSTTGMNTLDWTAIESRLETPLPEWANVTMVFKMSRDDRHAVEQATKLAFFEMTNVYTPTKMRFELSKQKIRFLVQSAFKLLSDYLWCDGWVKGDVRLEVNFIMLYRFWRQVFEDKPVPSDPFFNGVSEARLRDLRHHIGWSDIKAIDKQHLINPHAAIVHLIKHIGGDVSPDGSIIDPVDPAPSTGPLLL